MQKCAAFGVCVCGEGGGGSTFLRLGVAGTPHDTLNVMIKGGWRASGIRRAIDAGWQQNSMDPLFLYYHLYLLL